ncbi:hypothetical protein Tco_1123051 [Tanacetum coccineum]|uniref:Uncharacterized protein n=1 Tax=Tanacetum coccineum TaxID=301880 RepID=A0ABQ5J3B1_9ASTR
MSKPPSPSSEPPKEDSPKSPSNQLSPPSHYIPLNDPYLEVILRETQEDNQTQPPPPHSPNSTRGLISQEINHLQNLSNLITFKNLFGSLTTISITTTHEPHFHLRPSQLSWCLLSLFSLQPKSIPILERIS